MTFTTAIASGFGHSLPMVQAWSVLAAAMPVAARKSSSWIRGGDLRRRVPALFAPAAVPALNVTGWSGIRTGTTLRRIGAGR